MEVCSMNFKLSEDHLMIQKTIRDFAINEVAPSAAERDEEERFDIELFTKWASWVSLVCPWEEKIRGSGF